MKCLKLLFASILLPALLYSQTFIYQGNVSGTWTSAGNPYYILGNIAVNEVDILQIDPGVEIIFTNNYMFNILGTLNAIGSVSDSIVLTVADTSGFSTGTHLGWSGLRILYPGTAHLQYCLIEYSQSSGISIWSNLQLDNSTVRFCEGDGIHIFDAHIIINDVLVSDNRSNGIILEQWSYIRSEFNDFIIRNNDGYGLFLGDQSKLITSNGLIENNYNGGVLVGYETSSNLSNLSIYGNGSLNSSGGGVFVGGGCYMNNVNISNNIGINGAGIYCNPIGFEQLTILNSAIDGNAAGINGGGIYVAQGFIQATNCKINNNDASNGGGIYFSAVESMGSTDFINCEITENNAIANGGGIFCNIMDHSPLFNHVTVANNTANLGGGLSYATYDVDPVVLSNSIFWNNSPEQIHDAFSKVSLSYSNIEGGWPGTGNIQSNPLFKQPLNGDYQLSWNHFPLQDNTKSPCIDSGNPAFPFDPDATITDMGAHFFNQVYAALNLPEINYISDVPNDQGQNVILNWNRSILDIPDGGIISDYSIWRAQDYTEATWDYIGSIPALQIEEYSYPALTLADSISSLLPFYTFMVIAETSDPEIAYRSVPDSGYSVDNIAPAIPENISVQYAEGVINLMWGNGNDPDIDYYAIYKADHPEDFTVDPQFLISDTSFVDTDVISDTIYYRISAYDIHENQGELSEIIQIITIPGSVLEVKIFLEGPFYGTSMMTYLNGFGLLPLNQPYDVPPWNYLGLEYVSEIPNQNIVDWVLVEIRDATTVIQSQAAFLLNDGNVVSLDGASPLRISIETGEDIYIALKHRNHLAILSSNPVAIAEGKYSFDFSSSASQALGGCLSQRELATNIWGAFCGDANNDGRIDNADKNECWLIDFTQAGYLNSDFNMDGIVDMDDKNEGWLPNAGHSCQIP